MQHPVHGFCCQVPRANGNRECKRSRCVAGCEPSLLVLSFMKAQEVRLEVLRMPLVDAIWDLPDDPHGNVQHIAEHGLYRSRFEMSGGRPVSRDNSKTRLDKTKWPRHDAAGRGTRPEQPRTSRGQQV